jgi:hypothetical protein
VTCTDYKQGWASSIVEIRCPSVAQPLCATLRANSALRPTSSSFRVLGGIDHHHNQHNKTTTLNVHLNITATLLESDKNIAHNCLAGFDIPLRTHCDRKGHRLFAPGAFPPRVNKTALFELLQPRTTTRPSARYLLSSVTPTHCRRRAPKRTSSPNPQQWPQHRLQRRSARIHLPGLCTDHYTTTTSRTLPAVRNAALRKAIPTPQLTPAALPRLTFNAQPPRHPPAREHASPTHTYLHLHHQLRLSDTLSCTRRLARHLSVAHWPTCSATRTALHTATSPPHFLCCPHQARHPRNATPHP